MTALDQHDPSDPRSNTRDYRADEARSTTALRKCADAFKAWTEKPAAANAAALAAARARFREAVEAELDTPEDQQPHNEIGPPNVTPVGPIETDNSALDIGRRRVFGNLVVGAIHRDGEHDANIRG